jgi:hypothetical protein
MIFFGSLLDQFVGSFALANECALLNRIRYRLIYWLFKQDFDQKIPWIRNILFVFNFEESKIKIYVGVAGVICVN